MNLLLRKAKTAYGFTDYELSLIRYTLTALFYDISKFTLFGLYYGFRGMFLEFLFAIVPLILLRTRTGGLHMKNYWTCLGFTFLYLTLNIDVFPNVLAIHPLVMYPILLLCAVTDYCLGPNSLVRKTKPDAGAVKKAKVESFQIIMIISVSLFIFSFHKYLIISSWTAILHTIQLIITKRTGERK